MGLPRVNPDGSITLRSALAGPLITVVGPSQLPVGGLSTASQYWVDPVNGDDSKNGLSQANAVKTYRFGLSKLFQNRVCTDFFVVVNQLGHAVADDIFWALPAFPESCFQLVFQGVNNTILLGPVTVTAAVAVTNTARGSVTVAGADFSAFIGKRVRCISGPAVGCVGWIEALNGAVDSVIVTRAINLSTLVGTGNFAVGSVLVIEDLWRAPTFVPWQGSPSAIPYRFTSLSLKPVSAAGASTLVLGPCYAFGCEMGGSVTVDSLVVEGGSGGGALFGGCRLRFFTASLSGYMEFETCSFGVRQLDQCESIQLSRCYVPTPISLRAGLIHNANYVQSWDWTANQPAIEIWAGARCYCQATWNGSSTLAGTYGIKTRATGSYIYTVAGAKPTVAGAAAFNVDCAGTQVLYAAVPVVNAARLSAVTDAG